MAHAPIEVKYTGLGHDMHRSLPELYLLEHVLWEAISFCSVPIVMRRGHELVSVVSQKLQRTIATP